MQTRFENGVAYFARGCCCLTYLGVSVEQHRRRVLASTAALQTAYTGDWIHSPVALRLLPCSLSDSEKSPSVRLPKLDVGQERKSVFSTDLVATSCFPLSFESGWLDSADKLDSSP